MTPKKLARCFEVFATLVPEPLIAQGVGELADALKTIKLPKGVKVDQYIGESLGHSAAAGPDPIVGQICKAVEPLRRLLIAATSGATQSQVNAFFNLLDQNRDMSFAVFLSRIGLGAEEASSKAIGYVQDLQSAIADADEFAAHIRRLKSDKSLSPEDLSAIACAFTGLKKKWSRKNALDALVAKHNAYLQAISSFGRANGKSAA